MLKKSLFIILLLSFLPYLSCSHLTSSKSKDESKTSIKQDKKKSSEKTSKQINKNREEALQKVVQHYNARLELFKKENREIVENKEPEWKKQIVMFGDSITEGFNLKAKFPDKPFVNRGISSDHIKWLDEKGLAYRCNPELLAPNPSDIFILIGINEMGDSLDEIDTYIANYKDLLISLKKLYPSANIYTQSVLPTRDRYARLNPSVKKFNAKLKKLAAKQKVRYIDLYSLMIDDKGELKEEFSRDGLHLKPPAYDIWADILKKELNIK